MRMGSRAISIASRLAKAQIRDGESPPRPGACCLTGEGSSGGRASVTASAPAASRQAMNASSSEPPPCCRRSASGVPWASTLPACISEMRSQRSASFMKWVEMKIVTPSWRDSSISSAQKPSRAIGSTPEVGSSRIRISGLCSTATASWRRWRTPSGRLSGTSPAELAEVEPLDQLRDTGGPLLLGQMKKLGVQLQIVPHRQLGIEREGLRHVADAPACRHAVRIDGPAEEPRLALAGGEKARQHLHRGGLAAAVRAEKSEDLAGLDAKAHMVDGREAAEAHGEARGLDCRRARPGLALRQRHHTVPPPCRLRQEGDESSLERVAAGLGHEGRRASPRPGRARHASRSDARSSPPPTCRRWRRRRSCPAGAAAGAGSAPRSGAARAGPRPSSARRGSRGRGRGSARSTAPASVSSRPRACRPGDRRRDRGPCPSKARRCARCARPRTGRRAARRSRRSRGRRAWGRGSSPGLAACRRSGRRPRSGGAHRPSAHRVR